MQTKTSVSLCYTWKDNREEMLLNGRPVNSTIAHWLWVKGEVIQGEDIYKSLGSIQWPDCLARELEGKELEDEKQGVLWIDI